MELEDAKARFSEVVRRAQSEGPATRHRARQDAVVIISATELERLLPRQILSPFRRILESLTSRAWTSPVRPTTAETLSCDGLALDTNVISNDINPNGRQTVKALGRRARRKQVFPEHLTVRRYEDRRRHPNGREFHPVTGTDAKEKPAFVLARRPKPLRLARRWG